MIGVLEQLGEKEVVISREWHQEIAWMHFQKRGFDAEDTEAMSRLCLETAENGIKTHNILKAIHLEKLFGIDVDGCNPNARIERIPSRFKAVEVWNSNKKLGATVAWKAMDRAIELADEFGSGTVVVDEAWHYLWGGAYVLDAAMKGYIGYTNCTAMLAEVAPYGGKNPTLGTNPHSWAFPTQDIVGFPILIDWATSSIAMGRVQQLAREGLSLPEGCALDINGSPTVDPQRVNALLPFGKHKGYGLGLIDELYAAYVGGHLPTRRGRFNKSEKHGEKQSSVFVFKAIHPEALSSNNFALNNSQDSNIKQVIEDILGHGNEGAVLPGWFESVYRKRCEDKKGLIFTKKEYLELEQLYNSLKNDIL